MRRIFKISVYCFVLIHSSILSLHAEEGFDLINSSDLPNNLSSYFCVYEDNTLLLNLNESSTSILRKNFQKKVSDGIALNFGYTKSAHWLRVNLLNNSDVALDRMIEIRASRISYLEFHEEMEDGKFKSIFTGSALSFNSRMYKNRFFVFPLKILPKSNKTIYYRFESSSPIIIQAMLWAPQSNLKYERNDYFMQAWYFGMATAMILFNLLLFLSLKDVIYLIYIGFVGAMALSLATSNGLVKEFLWQNASEYYNLSSTIGFSFTFIAVIFFMRRMIFTWKIIPRIDRLLLYVAGFHLAFIGSSLFFYSMIAKYAPILFILTMVFLMGTGLYCAFLKQRPAYFFVIAYLLLFLTAVINGLTSLGILPAPSIRDNALQFGSAGEMLLLAFALADRYKVMQREKQNAQKDVLVSQKKTLDAEQRLVETLKTTEKILEQKVKERTQELDHMLNIFKHDLSVAKKIQENSLFVHPSLHEELNIVKTYLPMTEVGGDFYDICQPNRFKYRLFQADATGHGVQAAMITMAIKGVYDNFKKLDLDSAKIMEMFNSEFIDKYSSLQSLMTAIILDFDVNRKIVRYTSAGHPPAVLLNETGIQFLKTPGKIIGVNRITSYRSFETAFKPGDRIFIFTDGVFEEFNMRLEEFGEERFYSILEKNRNRTIKDTIDLVIQELYEFLEGVEKQDDLTILGVEYNIR